jgi:hypothetical protein
VYFATNGWEVAETVLESAYAIAVVREEPIRKATSITRCRKPAKRLKSDTFIYPPRLEKIPGAI